jgi:AcrR family transcriptional regulator
MSVTSGNPDRAAARASTRSSRHSPEQARREIAHAAVQFLASHAFRDLTVGELMAQTTLSRPAFYQYFHDLHDLLVSLFDEVEAGMRSLANPWIAGEGEPLAALRASLRGVIESVVEHGTVIRAVYEAAPLDERLEAAWSAFMRRWDDAVTARIEAHQQLGLIRPMDARRVANALNAMDAAVLIAEFGRFPQGDPDTVLDTLHAIWVGTLYGRPPGQIDPSSTDSAPRFSA